MFFTCAFPAASLQRTTAPGEQESLIMSCGSFGYPHSSHPSSEQVLQSRMILTELSQGCLTRTTSGSARTTEAYGYRCRLLEFVPCVCVCRWSLYSIYRHASQCDFLCRVVPTVLDTL
ncbi:unnamed protein product [Polarella glacialis]|uniref:Uncharacterized protein n=1 Tax=Polarella glacialis TaxID=89957 RepID=A0A813KQS3_POLGL|nr:unnamed protein product [Polarella glacialis]